MRYFAIFLQNSAKNLQIAFQIEVADQKIEVGPGYQLPFAERMKRETGMVTMAVGMITDPQQAETLLERGQADLVALARELLRDPHWPQRAASELGIKMDVPDQYARAVRW